MHVHVPVLVRLHRHAPIFCMRRIPASVLRTTLGLTDDVITSAANADSTQDLECLAACGLAAADSVPALAPVAGFVPSMAAGM